MEVYYHVPKSLVGNKAGSHLDSALRVLPDQWENGQESKEL